MTLLHARTHMNRTTTQYYINNGLDVAGIKLNMSDTNYNSDHCALCIKANMRKPHVGSANRDVTIYEVFEYFGLDFHGPFHTPAFDGSKYVFGFLHALFFDLN